MSAFDHDPPHRRVKLLHCSACTVQVEVAPEEAFDYTADGDGPFCKQCWFFVQHIEALRDRVTDLEGNAQADRGERQRQENIHQATRRTSPYDCSRRRF